ncbi:MAG: glycine--tRNA ligase subunit beta [Gammaproteobacteria bacterium]|nr:glycine--tRNA ligase subunit beta [Gammaproteobacteria bacterium]
MASHDLLIEILTEELPPKRLQRLEDAFLQSVEQQLSEHQLAFSGIRSFATPRRLALMVESLADQQPPQKMERKGPSVAHAFDAEQQLTPAGEGFLRSCGITREQLQTIETDKGVCLYYAGEKVGLPITQLIPDIVKKALNDLPIPKAMRWGDHEFSFIRPVHSVMLLYGEQVIPAEFFGKQTSRCTQGHRQLSRGRIDISFPKNYAVELEEKGCVIVDRNERKAIILQQIDVILDALRDVLDRPTLQIAITQQQEYDDLLDEITALVELPKVLLCRFDPAFLNVPKEALMASMQGHQKCFAIADHSRQILPYFITVSNVHSDDETAVVRGNERVMRARLSDAKFFYESDLKTPLLDYSGRLATTIYQEKLGTLQDKVDRVVALAKRLVVHLKGDAGLSASVERAARLCRLDLFTQMVGEFPELQGTMGKYYALHSGEPSEIACAIEEYYWPRFSSDHLPTSPISVILALADRLDTMVGFFSIGCLPTGDKDPFGLRRAALGVIKIVIDNTLSVTIDGLVRDAIAVFPESFASPSTQVFLFFHERVKSVLLEKNIPSDVIHALPELLTQPLHHIVEWANALQSFKSHPDALSIVQADKRVKNILEKNKNSVIGIRTFSNDYVEKSIEISVFNAINETQKNILPRLQQLDYASALGMLARLKPIIDQFFDEVMVMAEDQQVRHNRFSLLKQLRELFLQCGDLSELQLPHD